jgi:RNA polymerase sigma factor (sigma-70 family)
MRINSTDEELIQLYISGNELVFESLINKYRDDVFRFIYMKTKNKEISEDIFQETFIKVIIALRKTNYLSKGRFLFWVLQIANNLTMDYFRLAKKRRIFLLIDDYSQISRNLKYENLNFQEIIDFENNYFLIKHLIESKLIPEQREVLNFRFENKMSFKEIAVKQGVSINTALGRYRYAIDNLKKEIKKNKPCFY